MGKKKNRQIYAIDKVRNLINNRVSQYEDLRTVDFEFVGFSDEDKKEKKKIGMYVIYRFRNGSRMSVLVNESDVDSLLIDLDSYVKIMMDKACFSHEEE